jgi:hypothetical protein
MSLTLLLRWAAFAPFVDYVDISMRNCRLGRNEPALAQAAARSPMTSETRLNGWVERAAD